MYLRAQNVIFFFFLNENGVLMARGSGRVCWVACPVPMLPAFPGCSSAAAMPQERGPKTIVHFLLLSLTACIFSCPSKKFGEAVPLSVVEQNSREAAGGLGRGPGVLVIQDKPLESSPWPGIQKSLCRPDVSWPRRQTTSSEVARGY